MFPSPAISPADPACANRNSIGTGCRDFNAFAGVITHHSGARHIRFIASRLSCTCPQAPDQTTHPTGR